jgi:hypothetical protein
MIGGVQERDDDTRWVDKEIGHCYPNYPKNMKWFRKNAEIFSKVDKKTSKHLAKKYDCKLKECYYNSWKCDVIGKYRYFEGYVDSPVPTLSLAHSWLVDDKGNVIDTTLILDVDYSDGKPIRNRTGRKYVGIEIPREWLNKKCFKLGRTGDFMDLYSEEGVENEKK